MSIKALFFAAVFFCFFTASNAPNSRVTEKTSPQSGSQNAAAFNGAWRTSDNKGFSVMHDEYFNSVGEDSTGQWKAVNTGNNRI